MRIAVVGGTGFVGRAVVDAALTRGWNVESVPAPRIRSDSTSPTLERDNWLRENRDAVAFLRNRLGGSDVVVNAAGLAAPASADTAALVGANAAMVAVLARMAVEAGVGRFVQVSTAAVQGRRNPLDETLFYAPATPYAHSKMLGEQVLTGQDVARPSEVTIYRPTSVHGPDRELTRTLARVASLPVVPLLGPDDAPLPTAHIRNVGEAVMCLSASEAVPAVALHPSEGMTARQLLTALGARRFIQIPRAATRAGLGALRIAGRRVPRAEAIARRVELLALGQTLAARELPRLGFEPTVGLEGYRQLRSTHNSK